MTSRYNARRSRNLYCPGATKPYAVSRSKIELFLQCPRCFYLDRRFGTSQPPGFPFTINNAVDGLLKKEFDRCREAGMPHPLQAAAGIDAIPARHPQIDEWRENFKGVRALHEPTNLVISGAIDDLWIDSGGRFIVADYKATARSEPVTDVDKPWQAGYRRQMEIYQWLLRRNELDVSDTGYFVYCTGRANAENFDTRVEFDVRLIPYEGNDAWIEPALHELHSCLNQQDIPLAGPDCDYCAYVDAASGHLAGVQRSLL